MAANSILSKLIIQIAADTSKFGPALKASQTQFLSFIGSVKNAAGALGVAFGAVQVFNGIKAAVGIMADFERTMSEVRAITGATGDEFKSLEQDALRLGRSTKFTATQVGQLQIAYGRLGFTTKEILAATEATLDLAAATGEDLAKSADVAGSTVRGFGLDASETQRVVDVMASSFNKTALSLENFTESMKYVAPVAAAAGASVEETTALLGTLADSGIRGSMAGTSLRKIFTDMSKDGRPLQERLAELAKRGITMSDAFDEVGRTAQTSLLILAKNTEKTNELAEGFRNVYGEASKMARIMSDNLTGDVKKLTSAWEGLILKIGESDPWRRAVQGITEVINAIQGVSDIQSDLRNLAEEISKPMEHGGGNLPGILERLRKARMELGKPIDTTQVEELAEKYQLTSEQANLLYQMILDVNKSLSFQETAIKQFNEFAERNGYTDLTEGAKDYKDQLYQLILAEQIQKQNLQQLSDVAGGNAFADWIKQTDEQIAAYRRIILIINEYVSTLEAQKKKEEEVAKVQIENLDLYQELLKKKNEEFEMASVNDQTRLRLLAAEIAALTEKIKKLEQIRKLAQAELNVTPKVTTDKLTNPILKAPKFEPFKTFFDQYAAAIDALHASLQGLKSTIIEINLGQLIGTQVADLAFSLGEAAAGVGNFGTSILKSVIGFAKQLGEILVAAGFAMVAAKLLIKNPGTAIAAGVALLAISGAASAALNKSQQGFNGGSGSSSNSSKLQEIKYINRDTRLYVEGEFKLSGKTAVALINNQTREDNRIKPRGKG
jgi:hypothetical protein